MAQLGRREHYAIPIALNRAGMLAHFFTDTYAGPGSWLHHFAKLVPSSCQKGPIAHALTRTCEIPGEKVTAFNYFGALNRYKLSRVKSLKELGQVYVWAAKQFNQQILEHKDKLCSSQAIYAMNGALELFSFGKSQELKLIFNQIRPSIYEDKLVAEESHLYSDWQTEPDTLCEGEILERILSEYELADIIIVNSDFSKKALMSVGVDSARIRIVPLAIDTKRFCPFNDKPKTDKVNFLFLGQVCLRKGIHYALEAMRLVRSNNVTLTISGSLDFKLNRDKLQSYSDLYNYTGYVTGNKVENNYQMADVFIFPTISDGFGLTQLEAMACGLPVITTPNCAAIVRDGIDGFIVPIRDAQALAEKMDILARDHELRAWMSQNARQRAEEFSWEIYGERLIEQCLGVIKDNKVT